MQLPRDLPNNHTTAQSREEEENKKNCLDKALIFLILAQVIKLCSYRGISLIITLLRNQGKSKKIDIKHAQVNNTSWCSIVFFLHLSVAPPPVWPCRGSRQVHAFSYPPLSPWLDEQGRTARRPTKQGLVNKKLFQDYTTSHVLQNRVRRL